LAGVAKEQQAGGAMRSNVAKKQLESKTASSAASRPYRIEDQIGYLLRRAHQRASAIFQTGIGDPNITPTQYSSLAKLDEYTELSQNLLGRLVGMDKATMQGVVRRLKERGLVDSRPDPVDARRTLLSLTTEGQRLVNRLLVNGPAVSRETLKPLNPQEQKQLLDLLSRII
jgi:DNA-binding MarR family transcriptional regulator